MKTERRQKIEEKGKEGKTGRTREKKERMKIKN
jgi:hypothetical protein